MKTSTFLAASLVVIPVLVFAHTESTNDQSGMMSPHHGMGMMHNPETMQHMMGNMMQSMHNNPEMMLQMMTIIQSNPDMKAMMEQMGCDPEVMQNVLEDLNS